MTESGESKAERLFAEQAKERFDESVESLDGATRSRLNRDRQAALAEIGRVERPGWLAWAPAAGVAAAAVFAVILWTASPPNGELVVPAANGDIEILLTEDSFEMLEDLEFYSWIEIEDLPETANGNVG